MRIFIRKTNVFFFALLFICICTVTQGVAAAENSTLDLGIEYFQDGKYSDALQSFRSVLLDSEQANYHGTAYFLTAKTYLALGLLDNAEKNLEYFLSAYNGHPDYSEGIYQKGRLLYLQKEYENAIQVLTGFLSAYPDSPYAANSYYWIGESLYSLGKFEEAYDMYEVVIEDYPQSYKVEASKYKKSLIELEHRERELLTFLKWSHEEALRVIEDFQKREKTYEQAIEVYQKKLSALAEKDTSGQISLLNKELQEKESLIQTLQKRIEELETTVKSLKEGNKTSSYLETNELGESLETSQRESSDKEILLLLKEDYLNLLIAKTEKK